MTIRHHLDIATLMSCAAGSQSEAVAAVVASHLHVCGLCRSELVHLSQIGEAMFASLPPVAMDGAVPAVEDEGEPAGWTCSRGEAASSSRLPQPILDLIGGREPVLALSPAGPGVRVQPIALSPGARGDLCLIELASGAELPISSHQVDGMLFVIRGSYRDAEATLGAGDVTVLEGRAGEAPASGGSSGCLCLVAT